MLKGILAPVTAGYSSHAPALGQPSPFLEWGPRGLPTSERAGPDTCLPGACHLHSCAWWAPSCPRLGLSLPASLLGLPLAWEVKVGD